jgi:hypothetical protein
VEESSSSDEEELMKPRVSIGSIVTMIPPLRLSDSSSGTHSGREITVEIASSSFDPKTGELTSDGSRTETECTHFFLFLFLFIFSNNK